MQVLVTCGARSIGSHTVLSLLENNYEIIVYGVSVYKSLANSSIEQMMADTCRWQSTNSNGFLI